MKLFCVSLDTRNFAFSAVSEVSAAAAYSHFVRGLKKHGEQHRLPQRWFDKFADDVVQSEIETGNCYRDREKL